MAIKFSLLLTKARSSERDLDLWSYNTLLNQTFSKIVASPTEAVPYHVTGLCSSDVLF